MNQLKLTNILPTIGRLLTPVAMLVALTYEIVSSQADVTGGWVVAIHIGAAATAVGVEAVGIMAGHVFEGFWRIGDKARSAVAFGLLLIYTGAGLFILRDNAALLPVPIIAAVVYLVAGLAESLTETQTQQAQQTAVQSAFELEEEKKDRELERELRRQEQADKTAVQLARVEAKTVRKPAVTSRLDSGHLPGDARLHTREHKALIKTLTTSEIEQMAGVSDSTARRWKRQVTANGHLNGVTK